MHARQVYLHSTLDDSLSLYSVHLWVSSLSHARKTNSTRLINQYDPLNLHWPRLLLFIPLIFLHTHRVSHPHIEASVIESASGVYGGEFHNSIYLS